MRLIWWRRDIRPFQYLPRINISFIASKNVPLLTGQSFSGFPS